MHIFQRVFHEFMESRKPRCQIAFSFCQAFLAEFQFAFQSLIRAVCESVPFQQRRGDRAP